MRAIPQARDLAKRDNVEIRYHSIIYELIDEVKAAMGGLLSPTAMKISLAMPKFGKCSPCQNQAKLLVVW